MRLASALSMLALAAVAAGCGGAAKPEGPAVAGSDIPDNQVFLPYDDARLGYSLKYPEGWAEQRRASGVSFSDKSNRIRVAVAAGPAFTPASVGRDLAGLRARSASFHASAPSRVDLPSGPAFEVTYSTVSAPDPVTGKTLTLVVDRYYLSHGGKRATIDLGAAKGADNVDAYRLVSRSFRWR